MKRIYGLISISGFMITMLCIALTGIEVTKLKLTIIFLAWIAAEAAGSGMLRLIRRQLHIRQMRFTALGHSRGNRR